MKANRTLVKKRIAQFKTIKLSALLFIIGLYLILPLQSHPKKKTAQIKLTEILKKTAEYCKKLEHSSLYFVCLEKIKERIYYSHRTTSINLRPTSLFSEKTYVYDYQLIRKNKKITEQRILIRENGKEKNEKNARLKTKRFEHEYIIFGPTGLFSEYWQQHHDYKIIKEKKYKGEKAIIIEAIPKTSQNIEHLYGKIWVRKPDFSILKIEWNQSSMGNYKEIEEVAKSLNAKPQITFISEYGFEKNEIRFPSKYIVREEYIHNRTRRRFKKSETTVTYKDYKFFIVETKVKYQDTPCIFSE